MSAVGSIYEKVVVDKDMLLPQMGKQVRTCWCPILVNYGTRNCDLKWCLLEHKAYDMLKIRLY